MKPKQTTKGNPRKQYTAQFKEQALELAQREGVAKAASDLGLEAGLLYTWRAKRHQTGQTFEQQKLQQAELARLRRENAQLEQELAFLKKAAAYFAKQPK
jgi:transposase